MPGRKRAPKAYRNIDFLTSPNARTIRMLAEFYEPQSRFREHKINNIIVFFGSARAYNPKTGKDQLNEKSNNHRGSAQLAHYYDQAEQLASKLTQWSQENFKNSDRYHICSGGGPGIMEAANLGAQNAGGKSIGLNISLPMEQYPNPFIDEELNFEFHYFFMRKFWFVYLAKAIVVFPGGFGTMDEFFETLTLVQTKKLSKKLPIVVFGSDYWKSLVNFNVMVEWGTISEHDIELIKFSDDVDEAFEYLKEELTRNSNR